MKKGNRSIQDWDKRINKIKINVKFNSQSGYIIGKY